MKRNLVHHFVYKIIDMRDMSVKYTGRHSTPIMEDGYMGSGKFLQEQYDEQGEENFMLEPIEHTTKEKLSEREKYWIQKNNTLWPNGWNLTDGGESFDYVNEHRKEFHPQFTNKTLWSKLMKGARIKAMKTQKECYEKTGTKNAYYYCHTKEGQIERSRLGMEVLKLRYPNGIWSGKRHKQSTKKKIGALSSIHQSGTGNSQFGSMWITDGKQNRKIKKDSTIPTSFRKGRVMLMHS